MHILSSLTDNCSSSISRRGKTAVEFFSWPSLHERMGTEQQGVYVCDALFSFHIQSVWFLGVVIQFFCFDLVIEVILTLLMLNALSLIIWFIALLCFNSSLTIYDQHMSPVKRICVFEHSVITNFNCACPAIQSNQGSGFLSESSSWLTACMSEQRRFWRDCADAQARLNLRCSHRR